MPFTPADSYIATSEPMTHSEGILAVQGVRIDKKVWNTFSQGTKSTIHSSFSTDKKKSHLGAKPVFHEAEFSDSCRESDCHMAELL